MALKPYRIMWYNKKKKWNRTEENEENRGLAFCRKPAVPSLKLGSGPQESKGQGCFLAISSSTGINSDTYSPTKQNDLMK